VLPLPRNDTSPALRRVAGPTNALDETGGNVLLR